MQVETLSGNYDLNEKGETNLRVCDWGDRTDRETAHSPFEDSPEATMLRM